MSTPVTSFADDPLSMFAAGAAAPTAPITQPTAPVVQPTQPAAPAPTTPAPPQAITSLDQLAGQAPAVISRPNAGMMSLDGEDIQTSQFEFFKGRKGWNERIGILAPTKIYGGRTHYIEHGDKKGRYYCGSTFVRNGTQEVCTQTAPCCERLEPPRYRFAAPVVHYITQMNGNLAEPFAFQLKIWNFTDNMFAQLQTTNKEWRLSEHDLIVTCEDEKFQRLKYGVARECIYRRPDFLKMHGPTVHQWLLQTLPLLDKSVARRVQPQDWLPMLTGQVAGVGQVVEMPVQDIGDVLGRGI